MRPFFSVPEPPDRIRSAEQHHDGIDKCPRSTLKLAPGGETHAGPVRRLEPFPYCPHPARIVVETKKNRSPETAGLI